MNICFSSYHVYAPLLNEGTLRSVKYTSQHQRLCNLDTHRLDNDKKNKQQYKVVYFNGVNEDY